MEDDKYITFKNGKYYIEGWFDYDDFGYQDIKFETIEITEKEAMYFIKNGYIDKTKNNGDD